LSGGKLTLKRRLISKTLGKNSWTRQIRCSMITKTWLKLCIAKCFYPMLMQSKKYKESIRRRENNFLNRSTFNGKSSKNKKWLNMMRGFVRNSRKNTERK
jgi:hypothetical protein